ncbi:MAG: putative DNA-binding transcriptional regulator AlpA [Candidatus Azotimanducaceae bacterium]|jgi:predicted DNA-binding transcriptional regulator AlpA
MKYVEPTPDQRVSVLIASNAQEKLILNDVRKQIVPLSDATIWRLIQLGEFPKPLKLGRRSAWRMSEILWFCHNAGAES